MDERDNKALNELKMSNTEETNQKIQKSIDLVKSYLECENSDGAIDAIKILESLIIKSVEYEETNKLSTEEYLTDQFGDEEQFLLYSQEFPIWQTLMKSMECFASMRVEDAKKEWEKKEMCQCGTERIGSTKLWCCNQCGKRHENF